MKHEPDRPSRDLEERLLHGLLSGEHGDGPSPSSGAGSAEHAGETWEDLRAQPGAQAELEDLEAFLATCRAALVPEGAVDTMDTERLARSVLARTTRDDPGWRGDLRLIRGFVAARWRASWLLRVAAASLVLHVAALPLLAFLGFARRTPEFRLSFEPRSAPAAVEPAEPEREVEVEPLGDLPQATEVAGAAGLDGLEIENATRWARYHLEGGGPPEAGSGSNPVTRALAERGSYLRGGEPRSARQLRPGDPPVAAAIRVEHLLDRYVLEGRLPSGFSGHVGRLVDDLDPWSPASAAAVGVQALELRTLLRARAYGLLDRSEAARVERSLEAAPEALRRELEAWSPLAPGAPLDAGFLAALREAAPEELSADPVGESWLSWDE